MMGLCRIPASGAQPCFAVNGIPEPHNAVSVEMMRFDCAGTPAIAAGSQLWGTVFERM
jgi:hypothetical protein